jgi:hypothetical protein
MAYSEEFIKHLDELAHIYITECLSHHKETLSNKGEVIMVADRHIPTIDYFLRIWIPIIRNEKTIHRDTYYTWLNSEDKLKTDTIKKIDNMFKCLAKDIVANEGKGIFYAKNALGMHDRQQVETRNVDKFDFEQ